MTLLDLMFSPLFLPLILTAFIYAVVYAWRNKKYKEGSYYEITKHPYYSVLYNVGRRGEYLTYERLKQMEENGAKFLFNLYIPKSNGGTTEIDLLMICSEGIFIIESKNYSGWIFGSENQKNWYQTLPTGRGRSQRKAFYNPVMQNNSHIRHLRNLLGVEIPMHSVIVFSDRCKLKRVNISSSDISVINRRDVAFEISDICYRTPANSLEKNSIVEIYNKLYQYTQADEAVKKQHIADIKDIIVSEASEPIFVESTVEDSQLLKCPRCGGSLVLRTATRGTNSGNRFYGCSNYPRCKYIEDITKESQL